MTRLVRAVRILEAIAVAGSLAVIVVCGTVLAVLVFDEERGEQWTSGLRPVQFFRDLEADLLEDYSDVFSVAHNSGDSVDTTLAAIGSGADVIEVDVVSLNGRLYAAHDSPVSWFGGSLFRGPPLEHVWIASAAAPVIKLDLKENSPAFTELLLDFVTARQGQRTVVVVSGDPALLRRFAFDAPSVLRFLSVSGTASYDRFTREPELAALLDGVSIRHELLTDERAAWLEEHELLTVAWTVNDLDRVNELVPLGVDAITTDNLAIVALLSSQPRNRPRLERVPDPPTGVPASPVSAATGK